MNHGNDMNDTVFEDLRSEERRRRLKARNTSDRKACIQSNKFNHKNGKGKKA